MRSVKLYTFCMDQNKLLKEYIKIWIQYKYNTKIDTIFMHLKKSTMSDNLRLIRNPLSASVALI